MLIYTDGAESALRGDLVVRAVIRSDLTPIPQTCEIEVRETADTEPLKIGTNFKAGREGSEFLIVKNSPGGESGLTQGDRPVATRKITGILASCAAIAQRSQRSIMRYGASLGEIYRACGAQVRIDQDFTVPVFACYKGLTPSFEIAKALQEEAGALVLTGGKVAFRRLSQMLEMDPVATLREESTQAVESPFLERHMIPFAFSTAPDNSFLSARDEVGRGALYRPRADARILTNMGTVLIMRRKVKSDFAPHVNAGMRIDVAAGKFVVITAAHAFDAEADGDAGEQVTRLWLGEVSK